MAGDVMATEAETVQRGYISKQLTVWCGICCDWEQQSAASVRRFSRAMKKRGWCLTRARGWLCPVCGPKQRAAR